MISKNNRNDNVVIVTHKYVTHPDDELVYYLNGEKYKNVMHVCHSFSDAPDRRSYYVWYKNGKKYKEKKSLDLMGFPSPVIYLKEVLFTIKWILESGIKWDTYIGMDGLCVSFGNLLRFLKRVNRTIYWAIDFVPSDRFSSGLVNKIYHAVNTHGYKNSDEMWDLSPRMAEAREKFLNIKRSDYKKLKVVQYGMWANRIKKYTYNDCEKHTLVYMGHLVEKQGVQLVLKAIPGIIEKIPTFRFKIIGDGSYKNELIKLAKKIKVYDYCEFMGRIPEHRIVENEIAKSALAIAPYIKLLDKWTYYADPGKVKTYLACGVPVLLTNIPWNAKDIEKSKCGRIITEEQKDIISSILLLMDEKINQQYRDNAIMFSKSFNYQDMFAKLIL